MKRKKVLKGRLTALLMVLCMVAALLPLQAAAGSQSNRFEVVLDDVLADGTLPAELGSVQYNVNDLSAMEGDAVGFVSLDTDLDNTGDLVALTKGNTGGEQPKVKYQYDVTDTAKHFWILIQPAEGKKAMVYKDNAGQMTEVGSYTASVMIEAEAGFAYRISFTDAGNQPGGGDDRPFPDENGPDAAAPADSIKIHFKDGFGNSLFYDKFHADPTVGVMGMIQYSYDGTEWFEFSRECVENDSNLYWNTQGEAENKVHTYYFGSDNDSIKIKVVEGNIACEALNGSLTNSMEYTLSTGTTYDLVHDDGIRTLIWSDDSEEADARVEHGIVRVESAVVGEENALRNDGPFSQQGNKGFLGIKGGATVTIKLIPDYGYQVGSIELNGRRLTPQDEEATYTFTMPDTNLHLAAVFEESSDEINAAADGVEGGYITGGENVIDSGNLRLSVVNSTMTDAQKNEMQNSTAAQNTDILSYLEVDLEKFVNKGSADEEWTEDLEELSDKIGITLNVGTDLDANKTYVVIREHNGVYEQIPADYDKTSGTITFESDKFSNYALAAMTTAGDTKITSVELNNTNIPAVITSNMKIDEYKQPAYCITEGCGTNPVAEWYDTTGGGIITTETVLKGGNTICQTITVKADDGYAFDALLQDNTTAVTFNGNPVNYVTLYDMDGDGKEELVVGVEYEVKALVEVDTIKIKNVTLSYKDGGKPVFTAESEEPGLYYVYLERITDQETGNFLTSQDYFNNEEHRGEYELLQKFESGKTYSYAIWVKPAYDGDVQVSTLEKATKIVINGTTYDIVTTGDKVNAQNDWAGINFRGVPHFTAAQSGDEITSAEDGNTNTDDKKDTNKDTNKDTSKDASIPQTGDNSHIVLWAAFIIVCGAAAVGVVVSGKRKKE